MKLTADCFEKYISPYEREDIIYEEDFDIISTDLLKKIIILLGSLHDDISRNSEEDNELDKHKEIFNSAKTKMVELNKIVLALCHTNLNGIEGEADTLSNTLGLSGTTYYDINANILDRITQISKFTNRNTLHSMVINAIAGERYNIDINMVREKILTLYLGISRLLKLIEEEVTSNLDSILLEILIYCTSLNILFNINKKDLECQ